MKLFQISLLLFSALLLNACIGEDMDLCTEITENNNLSLEFLYMDGKQAGIFSDKIHKVDVFVFDEAGCFIQNKTVEKVALSAFEGTALSLQPGTYRIVCWGNAFDKTLFSPFETGTLFENAFTGNSIFSNNTAVVHGDPLYYAPHQEGLSSPMAFTVTIPENGSQTAAISFREAHITVKIYIKGFEDRSGMDDLLPPDIELTEIPAYYNFDMQSFGDAICHRDASVHQTIEGEQMAVIDFQTPVFSEDTPMHVLIKKSSDSSIVTAISMKEFIKENNIIIETVGETVIPILVEYKQAVVEISLPGWGKNPVEPEL